MKVILYMAISADGFIATKSGNSDWVSDIDIPIFEKKIKDIGCIVLGGNTYRQFKGQIYPVKDVLNIIVSSEPNDDADVIFVKSPEEAIKVAESNKFKELLLVGGGTLNGSFLKSGLIDEFFVDMHPLILGDGIKLFEGYDGNLNLEKIDFEDLDKGQILLHYKVIK